MESIIQSETDSEYYSVINQIDVYLWLKERNPQYTDEFMERRIKLSEMGLLRKMLEDIMRRERTPRFWKARGYSSWYHSEQEGTKEEAAFPRDLC